MCDLQGNVSFFCQTTRVQLARAVIIIALMISGCGTRQSTPATEQAAETPGPRPTITKAPSTSTLTPTFTPTPSPLPPSSTPTPTLEIGSTQISPMDGMVLMYIPGGTFQMGSESGSSDEQPVHSVTLDAFWMDQTEVTNAMYANFINAMGNQSEGAVHWSYTWLDAADSDMIWLDAANRYVDTHVQGSLWEVDAGRGSNPVDEVSWYGAAAYCRWAGRELPTEAQWEYAAHGGLAGALYPWGNETPSCTLGAYNGAQYSPCSPDDTIAVASFVPNGYGLFDMAGNVSEWVADWYGATYYSSSPVENPAGPASGDAWVLRGGAWDSDEDSLRVSSRGWSYPFWRFYIDDGRIGIIRFDFGFRCASSP